MEIIRNGFQPTESLKDSKDRIEKTNNATRILPTFKRKIVLEAYIQTGYDQYTHMFKTVEIELPDDGIDWHVAGEIYGGEDETEELR